MSLKINLKGDEAEYLCINKEDIDFNTVIGCIEDMLMTDAFQIMQKEFLNKYWDEFEDSEENKHIYMEIFEKYQNEIENYIEVYLKSNINGFRMETFIQELLNRRDELDGEIFEILFTLSDFVNFKEMFLDYKAMKEGRTVDLSSNISITKITSM